MNFASVSGKSWIFKKYNESDIKKYIENYNLSETTAKLLSIRKKNIDNVDLFLNPTIKNLLPNPLKLKGMNEAVNRIYQSIIKNEMIGIFGDYDVDGASSTALLYRYFYLIKQKICTHIPDRKKEGYGPTINGFNNLIKNGSKVIITVDCGTLSFEPIKAAQNRKIDVIVLDHHQSDIKLPNACAIVNPNRLDDDSNLNYLCATGVCFMFLVALNKKLRDMKWFDNNNLVEPNIINFLDLVSLGTVCDVVPLVGLNRAIVKQGLKILKKRLNLGLKTLYDLCKIESQPTTYDLGYILGPRINAGGRVGRSSDGAELLSSNNPERAYQIALALDKSNTERQSIELIMFEKINSEAKKSMDDPVLILSGYNWHEGIIGIIAAKIKEKYNKPTIIISLDKNLGKGSARSIFGYDVGSEILKAVQMGLLIKGGGHKMAGGFLIKKEKINDFRKLIINNFKKNKVSSSQFLNLYLDSMIAPSALNEKFYNEIECLSPFGSGNSEPKFVIENLKVISSSIVGKKHIKSLLCGKDGSVFTSIAFNAIDTNFESILDKKYKKRFHVAGKMKLNEWRGKNNIEFLIEDISLT